MTGDPELLRRYAEEGSEEAFAELVRRHIDFVYGVALRHGRSPHRAQDAAQAVFIDLARKARVLAGRTELVGWLFVSARYAALKIVRGEALRAAREEQASMSQRDQSSPTNEINWSELQPLLDDALQQLGEADRSAVLLRCVKGLSFAEVGASLAMGEDAARKRVERALQRLQRRLIRRGAVSTAGAMTLAFTEQAATAAPSGLAASVTNAAVVAGSSGAVLPSLILSMTTSKIAAGAAIIAGVLALASAVREIRVDRQNLLELGAAQAADRDGASRVASARNQTRAAEAETAALRQALVRAMPIRTLGGAGVSGGLPRATGEATAVRRTNDPRTAAAMREIGTAYLRANARNVLRYVARELNLPAGQLSAVANIQAASYNTQINGVSVPGNSDEVVSKGTVQITDLIGEANGPKLTTALKAQPYLHMASEIAWDAGTTDTLSPQQTSQVAATLLENQVQAKPENWPTALSVLSGTLSPEQFRVLQLYASAKSGFGYAGGLAP